MTADASLIAKTAREIVDLLKTNEVSPLDLLDTLEARIGEVDGTVNALPTLCFDRARGQAKQMMDLPVEERGLLAGAPIAIKDLSAVKDVLFTSGSPIYADRIPTENDVMVDVLEDNGAIVYAKSNTPEFGAGANTFNEVFGRTVNPWDISKSCAGSSGGSAVALATGTAWLASGSDYGGSLRNPASFCSIVGMRPTPGRVGRSAGGTPYANWSVNGPMARNVPDVAMLLDAMVAQDPRDPISLHKPHEAYVDAVAAQRLPKRIAFSRDLGVTPIDPEIADICEAAAKRFEELGVIVEEAHPDFGDLQDVFWVNRVLDFYTTKKGLLETHRDMLKPEVIHNIEAARGITADDVARVELERARIYANSVEFFKTYDLLLSPATIVPPFPIEQRFVEECNGHKFSTYIEWCSIAYAITTISCPALSLPCGFTKSGMPVGLQIAGPQRGEAELLSGAALLEDILGVRDQVPIDPRGA